MFFKKIINWFCCIKIIRCARCWKTIFPGDPITLQKEEYSLTPKNKVVLNGKSVCCLRKSCSDGHQKDGYWTGSGVEFYNW